MEQKYHWAYYLSDTGLKHKIKCERFVFTKDQLLFVLNKCDTFRNIMCPFLTNQRSYLEFTIKSHN